MIQNNWLIKEKAMEKLLTQWFSACMTHQEKSLIINRNEKVQKDSWRKRRQCVQFHLCCVSTNRTVRWKYPKKYIWSHHKKVEPLRKNVVLREASRGAPRCWTVMCLLWVSRAGERSSRCTACGKCQSGKSV